MTRDTNATLDPPAAASQGRKLTILGIDDDQDHLFILETLLRRMDSYEVQVIAQTDHRQALEIMRGRAIDLLIIDYDLKTAVATSVIDTIRASGFRQPILVLTGVGNEIIAAKVMKSGASDYIVKSNLSPEALRLAIEGALARRRLEEEKAILERELLESQKMEAIGTLIGGIAFDFNNLLTVILSEAELGMKGSPEDAGRHFERIQVTGYIMADLVRRLVAFDQTTRESPGTGHIGMVATETCGYLHHVLPRTIQLVCDTDGLSTRVNVPEGAIRQIIINLALNAADAMPSGGQLLVKVFQESGPNAENGSLPDHLRQARAVLEVADSGKGITPEIRTRIFEPFFTTKIFAGQKGTGLGLSMVWQLVHALHGHIQVDSELGKGTTFRILLPLDASPQQDTKGGTGAIAE